MVAPRSLFLPAHGAGFIALLAGLLVAASGCVIPDDTIGQLGEERRAYFASNDTDLVFGSAVMVGSTFEVHVQPVDGDTDGALAAGTLTVDDGEVFAFLGEPTAGHTTLHALGPGQTYLRVSNPAGEEVDRIEQQMVVE